MRKISLQLSALFGMSLLLATVSPAATLQVGPGQTYAKPCAAIAAAAPGDTILIDAAGNYNGDVCQWFTNQLTLRGVNGRPHIDAAGMNAAGKGIWVIDGNDTVVENIEFSGATVPDGNGVAIRLEGVSLTLRYCYIHNNQEGILTSNPSAGDILFEYSEFAYNGTGNGHTHNMYIGHQNSFTMRYCYSHHAYSGQLVKTRAANNYILYNRLTTQDGQTSYEIDIPNGGLSYVVGNLIQQGVNGQNSNVMDYMIEGEDPLNPDHRLFVANNTFVNDKALGSFILMNTTNTTPAVVQNNIFVGPPPLINQSSAILSNNLSSVDPLFVNRAAYDYHLQSGSPAINAGIDPGMGAGFSLNPAYEYVHPTCAETRSTVGSAIDIGAYEYGNAGTLLTCSSTSGVGDAILTGLTVNPSVLVGGETTTATATLNTRAPAGGLTLTVSSSNSAVASAPAGIAIAAGATGVTFPVTTAPVSALTNVTLSGTIGGFYRTAGVTVSPSLALSQIQGQSGPAASALITWTTSVDATSQVNYGTTTAYGSSSALNPANVLLHSVILTGLAPSTLYHFQVISKDTGGHQVVSGDYTFQSSTWSNRKAITINHTQVSGNAVLTSFPVLVSLTDASLQSAAKSDGSDIIFTAADGMTRLSHEIEHYSSTTGNLVAWVQVPVLSPATDTVIYMYYGNPSASQEQNPAGVWTNHYTAILHLDNNAGITGSDSTGNGNSAVINGVTAAGGKMGGGGSFNGTSYLSPAGIVLGSTNTISAWFYDTATAGSSRSLWGNSAGYTDEATYNAYPGYNHIGLEKSGIGSTSTKAYTPNAWHQVVVVNNAGSAKLYVDGAADGLTLTGMPGYVLNYIGRGQSGYWGGSLDEIRVSDVARSNDWILTEYRNQNTPASFFTVGSLESGTGGSAVAITVTSTPAARALTVDSVPCTSPCGFQWAPGSTHTIAAATQAGATGVQYLFTSWSDAGAASHSITVPAVPTTYTAAFQTQYYLTASASPAADGIVNPANGWHNAGTVVPVSAAAAAGFQFTGFSGALTGTTTPQNVTMAAPVSVTASFTAVTQATWYGVWSNRKQITLNHAQVSGAASLANFPVLISLTDADLKTTAKTDGSDILFTAADGLTKLNHEIELYTSATGQLVAWVSVPALSPSADTIVYMYYGNPSAANQQNAAGVWDSSYKAVLHLGNSTGLSSSDSTSNGNSTVNSGVTAAAGKMGGGGSFNGSAYLALTGIQLSNTHTVSLWFYDTAAAGSSRGLWGNSTGYANGAQYNAYPGYNTIGIDKTGITTNSAHAYLPGAWHHLVLSNNAGTATLYVDGKADGLVVKTTPGYLLSYLGRNQYGYWGGSLDEIRVSDGTARSSDWIVTEYRNQNTPASFFTVGAAQNHP
jgi:hypothetical protein